MATWNKLDPAILAETRRLYVDEGLSLGKIGERFGISPQAVQERLKTLGVRRRGIKERHPVVELVDYDLIHRLYVIDGLNCAEVGAKLGMTTKHALAQLKRHGIERRKSGWTKPTVLDRDLLYKLYVVDGLYIRELKDKFGVGQGVIYNNLRRYGIYYARPRLRQHAVRIERDVLHKLYVSERLSCAKIGVKLGLSRTTIAKELKRNGIELNRRRGRRRFEIDRDPLYNLYVQQGRSAAAIAAMFGTSPTTIMNRLTKYGIPRHPRFG
jgi:transposase